MNKIRFLILMLLITLAVITNLAQDNIYTCDNLRARRLAWSPDGQHIAVETNLGVQIYNPDLEYELGFNDIYVEYERIVPTGPVWSPNSEKVFLPAHATSPPIPVPSWAVVNIVTGEISGAAPVWDAREIVWSPDSNRIVALIYPSEFGFSYPKNILQLSGNRVSYDQVQLTNLRWTEESYFTVNASGVVLAFDPATLEIIPELIEFRADWWLPSPDGQRYAAQRPDIQFVIRDSNGEERSVDPNVMDVRDAHDEPYAIGTFEDYRWLMDNRHIIGIYGFNEEYYPEALYTIFGAIVDADTAQLTHRFVLQADGEIQDYNVSPIGDRIILSHGDTWLELWNPMTNERLATIEVVCH